LLTGVGAIALAAKQEMRQESMSGSMSRPSGARSLAAARERFLKRENPSGFPEGIQRDDSPAARRERRAERLGRRNEWEDDGGWDGGM
jgi:hypothetical protein